MSHSHLNCRELADFLAEGVEAAFREHMELCPPCVVYLENYQRTVELGRDACCGSAKDALPEDVPEQLVRAILDARNRG